MNCQEVQLQLSGYLEKSLDAIRMKSIETHLGSCPFCRAEANGLSHCIQQISDLPIIEPPDGFAQRVMAHARALEAEPRAWQWLFGAVRSTVPIQAAAVVLVTVLAVVLYQKEPQFKAPVTESSPARATQQAEQRTSHPIERAPERNAAQQTIGMKSPALSPAQPAAPATRQTTSASDQRSRDEAKISQPIPGAPSNRAAEAFFDVPRRAPIHAQEVSTGGESPRPSADALGMGALSRQPFRGGPARAERPLSPLSEPRADFEFVVRRRALERFDQRESKSEDALRQVSEADAAIATAAARRAASPTRSIMEIRWFNVAPNHLEQFRKELAAEAIIDSEKSPDSAEKDFAMKSGRELLVKVIILSSER